jgi:cell division protease FtsH
MRKPSRNPVVVFLGVLVVLFFALLLFHGSPAAKTESVDQLYADARAGKVASATLVDKSNVANAIYKDGSKVTVHYPALASPNVMGELIGAGVKVDAKTHRDSLLSTLLVTWLPLIVLFGIVLFVLNSMQGGGTGSCSSGRRSPSSTARINPR